LIKLPYYLNLATFGKKTSDSLLEIYAIDKENIPKPYNFKGKVRSLCLS